MRGLFITVEGMDGCGKTTQVKNIVQYLKKKGHDVLTIREPGGTKLGEKIRCILLDIENKGMNIIAELMLYAAARAELVSSIILPALNQGKIVICDRFIDSSIAYQGFGRNLGNIVVEDINSFAIQGCIPDLTFFFDVSPEEILTRKTRVEHGDRIETETMEFHNKVYEGYLELSKQHKERIKVIDARRPIEDVYSEFKYYMDLVLVKELNRKNL
ncbi:MAG TPA: dTMP kinase [Clostridiales bacterium]|nr:dTMP kinase [Clostridiales bacterium]